MILTYELDLDIFTLDLHAKMEVHTLVRSAFIARRTDGQTDTHTMPKLLHPTRLKDVGCKNHMNQVESDLIHSTHHNKSIGRSASLNQMESFHDLS